MADKSWISRLFGRSNSEAGSPKSLSSASSSPISSRSPQISTDTSNLLKDIVPVSTNGVSPVATRNVMFFSPESALNSKSISVPTCKFDATATRKRQLSNFEDVDGEDSSNYLASSRIKRFREGLGNSSLVEAPVRASVISSRLDTTWGGSDSPAASSSLKSKISLAPSANSKLSSKTRAILEQLERISTPSLEAKRTPIIRSQTVQEKWNSSTMNGNHLNKSLSATPATPPPLKRQSVQVPSRVQILSSTIATMYKKPYWRDLSRKEAPKIPEHEHSNTSIQSVKNNAVVKVSPLFDIAPIGDSKKSEKDKPVKPVPIFKNFDGSNVAGKNTFSAHELDEESGDEGVNAGWMTNGTSLPTFDPPVKGFLDDAIFSFATPAQRGPSQHSDNESDSDESDSGSSSGSESKNESDTDEAKSEPAVENDKKEELRPTTSSTIASDTQTLSNVATPASSKNTSPLGGSSVPPTIKVTPPVSTWDCPDCFCSNKSSDAKCPACGHMKDAAAPAFGSNTFVAASASGSCEGFAFKKNPSFGLSTKSDSNSEVVAPAKTGATIFDSASSSNPTVFGGSKKPVESSAPAPPSKEKSDWSCPDCFCSNKSTDDKCPACGHEMYKTVAAPPLERKAWDCPDCFCGNKATDDKCPACGHVKYKTEDAAPVIAFGDKAFKPTSSTGVSFGFGSSVPAKTSSSSTPSFGFGLSKTSEIVKTNDTPKVDVIVSATDTAPMKTTFGLGTTSNGSAPLFGLSAEKKEETTVKPLETAVATNGSIFGSSKPLFGGSVSSEVEKEQTKQTTTFGVISSATPVASIFGAAATSLKPIFGTSTTTTAFSSTASTSFGSTAVKPMFGTPSTSTLETTSSVSTAPKPSLFAASATSLFGSSGPNLFDKRPPPPNTSIATTSSSVTTPIFGSSTPAFSLSGDNTGTAPIFGASTTEPAKPVFGSSRIEEESPAGKRTRPFAAESSAPSAFPSSTTAFQFGSVAPASNGFSFGSSASTMTSSNSTPSLSVFGPSVASTPSFGAPTEPPKAFNFGGAPAAPTGAAPFQFGSSTTTASSIGQPFVFGASNTAVPAPVFNVATPAPNSFAFGAAPITDSPFAFSASSGSGTAASTVNRKVAAARRRLTKR